MNRLHSVIDFIEFDRENAYYLEPAYRYDEIVKRIFDVIDTYTPSIIVKIGVGSGKLIIDILKKHDGILVVVDPSLTALTSFTEKNSGMAELERIRMINGEYHLFPVDYYKADLIICIDYLNFLDSSKSIDEFKRALQFDGILFFSGVVLVNEDVEGVYDDFNRIIFPLHNDFYLENDLKTLIELKGFSFIKGSLLKFNRSLTADIEYFQKKFTDIPAEQAREFIQHHREEFEQLYELDDTLTVKEPYFIGFFSRKKPD